MSAKRTSREIIWQHAFDYRWERRAEVRGDPGCDMFVRSAVIGTRDPMVVVHYAKNGRVVDAFLNGRRLPRLNRDAVLDALEARTAPSSASGVVGTAGSGETGGEAK